VTETRKVSMALMKKMVTEGIKEGGKMRVNKVKRW
jgi:hypothetical protein